MFRRRIIILSLVLALSIVVSALPLHAQEAVTIRVWTHRNDAFNAGLEALAETYMQAHPEVTINFETFEYATYIQTLQTAMPAGTEADIVQMFGTWTCGYANGGRLALLPADVLSVEEAEALFFEAPLGGYNCPDEDGEPALYGLPQEFNIEYGAVLVNTEIAEAMGVTLPDPLEGWATWDDLIADTALLTEGDLDFMTRAGFHFTSGDAIPFMFYSLIAQQGGQFYDEATGTFSIDTEEGRAALELMVSMVQDHNLVSPELFGDEVNWIGDAFFTDQAATGLIGPWVVPEYGADFPEYYDKLTYIRMPSLGEEPVFVADSGWGLSVSVNSQVQEAAWEFIKFAATDAESALAWNIASGTLPALRELVEDEAVREAFVEPQPWVAPFLEIFPYGTFMGHLPDRDLLWYDITGPHVINAMIGLESVDEALAAMEAEANG